MFGVVGVVMVVVAGLPGVGVDSVDVLLQVGTASAGWYWLQSFSLGSALDCGWDWGGESLKKTAVLVKP